MKILILAHHRSGSTSLLNGLLESISNSLGVFEPFKTQNLNSIPNHISYLTSLKNNIIEKHLITQPTPLLDNNVSFFKKYILNFDKVIILLRKDQIETAKSHNHLFKSMSKNLPVHVPYNIEKDIDISQDLKSIKDYHKALYKFSSLTKIPIIFYEDLYSGDKNFLKYFLKIYNIQIDNFDLLYECLNPKNRYRQN